MFNRLDISTAITTALVLTILIGLISAWVGVRSIASARRLPFFRMRRDRSLMGWRMLFMAVLCAVLAYLLPNLVEPAIYRFYPPTATPSLTPTITLTPTISLTPTITLTPSITPTKSVSDTPTVTPTPNVPLAVEMLFESTVTPLPGASFSQLTFTDGLDNLYRPLKPGTLFQNPVSHMYAVFSYEGMVVGAQWTALWYRDGELVHYETIPWNGGSGGLGYTDWGPDPSEWLPGTYEVQIFVGLSFQVAGQFVIEGEPPTAQPSPTATRTPTPTRTPIPTRTPRPTFTPTSTRTPTPTRGPYVSPTATLKPTAYPTLTRTPTRTPRPTWTPTVGATSTTRPTAYPTLTRTPTPTPR